MRGERRFFPEVEALRGAAALMVAGEHSMSTFVTPDVAVHSWPLLVLNGAAAVIVFFVMSGFVLSLSLATTKPSLTAYFRFLERRLFRIVPAMWLSVALAVCVYLYIGAPLSVGLVLKHLVFADSSIDGPLWSLRPEMFYSALLPLAVWLSVATHPILLLPIAILAAKSTSITVLALNNLEYALPFALGLMVAPFGPRFVGLLGRASGAVAIACIVMLCVSRSAQNALGLTYGEFVCGNAVLAFPLVCHCAFGGGVIQRALGTPFFRHLGRISYSFYVLHYVVLVFVNVTLFKLLPRKFLFDNPLAFELFDVAAAIPLAIGLATFSYHWIERPFIALARRREAVRSIQALSIQPSQEPAG